MFSLFRSTVETLKTRRNTRVTDERKKRLDDFQKVQKLEESNDRNQSFRVFVAKTIVSGNREPLIRDEFVYV